MSEHPAIERAIEIVNATEWEGDLRVNMTTVIGAGRVLAKALEEKRDKNAALVEAARAVCDHAIDEGHETSGGITWIRIKTERIERLRAALPEERLAKE